MKKIFLVLTILLMVVSYSSGQNYSFLEETGRGGSDGFFANTYSEYREENLEWGVMPMLPRTHGYAFDYDADASEPVPVGSGLVVLGLLGIGYAAKKRKDNE